MTSKKEMKATAIFTGRREFLLVAAQNGKDRIQACPVVESNLASPSSGVVC
jgi:hypothetical protein